MPVSIRSPLRPFLVTITARSCECGHQGKADGPYKALSRAIEIAAGYWNVYLAFFGDQIVWLEFTVVDTRDGRVMWVNGKRQEGASNGAFGQQ